MILMAAEGMDNDEIAVRLDTRREVVSQSQPDRNLLLGRAAQGADPERLPLLGGGRRAAGELPKRTT